MRNPGRVVGDPLVSCSTIVNCHAVPFNTEGTGFGTDDTTTFDVLITMFTLMLTNTGGAVPERMVSVPVYTSVCVKYVGFTVTCTVTGADAETGPDAGDTLSHGRSGRTTYCTGLADCVVSVNDCVALPVMAWFNPEKFTCVVDG